MAGHLTYNGGLVRRVLDRVVVSPSGCWEWQGTRSQSGYGQTCAYGKHVYVHRLMWHLRFSDPGDLFVLHRCDNPSCCNPHHLFVGTPADNHADMVSKGRARKRGLKGSLHPNAKASESDVVEMRRLWAEGVSSPAIARRFGLSDAASYAIVSRKTWTHVP